MWLFQQLKILKIRRVPEILGLLKILFKIGIFQPFWSVGPSAFAIAMWTFCNKSKLTVKFATDPLQIQIPLTPLPKITEVPLKSELPKELFLFDFWSPEAYGQKRHARAIKKKYTYCFECVVMDTIY